jgi:hypothetical protein
MNGQQDFLTFASELKLEIFVLSFAVYRPYHSWWGQLGICSNLIFLSLFLLSLKRRENWNLVGLVNSVCNMGQSTRPRKS